MFYQKGKKIVFLAVVLLILMGSVSLVSANEVDYDIYNITKEIGYTAPLTKDQVDEINADIINGNEFAKRIGGKLVNYDEFYNSVVEVVVENSDLSMEEIVNKIITEIPNIIARLDEVIVGEVLEGKVTAKFRSAPGTDFMGYVEVEVEDIPNAEKYAVIFKLTDGRELTSKIATIGQTEDLPLVRYNDFVTIEIYDANETLIDIFKDIKLIK